jgi:hypothetical protein
MLTINRRRDLPPDSIRETIPCMLQDDSRDSFEVDPVSTAEPPRSRNNHHSSPSLSQNLREIQPLPRWTRFAARTGHDAKAAAFFAGANLLALDQILRSGEGGAEPVIVGALRQRLALKAAASSARLVRLREDEAALRDAEDLAVSGETSPAGRVHRLFRLFASHRVRFDAATLSIAAEQVGTPSAVDVERFSEALRQTVARANDPLAAAAGVSRAAAHDLAAVPAIEAEIFALWLADVALAQKLGWHAPVPLLAAVVAHPALRRGPIGRRPRPADRDWSDALAAAYALAACEAIDFAGALSRQAKKLCDAAPKLRAKGAARVIEMLLDDDCLSASRAAKRARLSDRGARRLFDRLVELKAVRELTERSNFRLYGL